MIGKLTYDQILEVSKDLREQADIISSLVRNKDNQELLDFAATVEGYSKYLETTVNALPTETYDVDDAIVAAISKYYTDATSGNFKSFHFGVDKVKELVDAQSDAYVILDVRSAEDYAKGHIAGAINIPFGKNMQEAFNTIPEGKPVVVCCYSGQTASQVLGVLRLLGYEA